MRPSDLSRKLLIKPGQKVLVHSPPATYMDHLEPLPEGASAAVNGTLPCDQVQLFAYQRAQLEAELSAALRSLKPGGRLWEA